MKRVLFFSVLILAAVVAHAQGAPGQSNYPVSVKTQSGAPSGNCPGVNVVSINVANGDYYDCPVAGGPWVKITGGGGGSGVTEVDTGTGLTGGPCTTTCTIAIDSTVTTLTGTQTLTNKTVDGVTPTTMGFVDPTSSIQTQFNAKAPIASPTFTGTVGGINATMVGLGSVTNDAQTKAAIVPNTAPSAGQILAGNAGGTAYAPVSVSGDSTITSAGVVTNTKLNGVAAANVCTPGSFASQTDGATVTWAIASVICANASLTFTVHGGSRTLNLTGLVNGGSYALWIKQDATGGEGLTLGTGCTWKVSTGGAGAITPSTGANAIDVLAFTYDGTNCYLNFAKNFS